MTTKILAMLMVLAALPAAAEPPEEQATTDARRAYLEGVELVKKAQWADALAAFEKSAMLRPHATTTFSIGACERALGRHTRARATLKLALSQNESNGSPMPSELVSDAHAFIDEIDRLLAHVDIHVEPAETEITVDGRPLQLRHGTGAHPILVAGMLPPGSGSAPPAGDFELIVEPGAHVIMLARKGYTNVALSRTFAPGSRSALPLVMAKMPGTIQVTSREPGAAVRVDGVDVGATPVETSRPAGTHQVLVRKQGFLPYQTFVRVDPGQRVELHAPLPPLPIYKKWWFWTAAAALTGAAIVGIAVGVTQQQPPPYNGGNTNWVARSQ